MLARVHIAIKIPSCTHSAPSGHIQVRTEEVCIEHITCVYIQYMLRSCLYLSRSWTHSGGSTRHRTGTFISITVDDCVHHLQAWPHVEFKAAIDEQLRAAREAQDSTEAQLKAAREARDNTEGTDDIEDTELTFHHTERANQLAADRVATIESLLKYRRVYNVGDMKRMLSIDSNKSTKDCFKPCYPWKKTRLGSKEQDVMPIAGLLQRVFYDHKSKHAHAQAALARLVESAYGLALSKLDSSQCEDTTGNSPIKGIASAPIRRANAKSIVANRPRQPLKNISPNIGNSLAKQPVQVSSLSRVNTLNIPGYDVLDIPSDNDIVKQQRQLITELQAKLRASQQSKTMVINVDTQQESKLLKRQQQTSDKRSATSNNRLKKINRRDKSITKLNARIKLNQGVLSNSASNVKKCMQILGKDRMVAIRPVRKGKKSAGKDVVNVCGCIHAYM